MIANMPIIPDQDNQQFSPQTSFEISKFGESFRRHRLHFWHEKAAMAWRGRHGGS
jgi:hypothetical protein